MGTQGVRGHLANATDGSLLLKSHVDFPSKNTVPIHGVFEQDPSQWIRAILHCIGTIVQELRYLGMDSSAITAVSATSTSGTILPLDKNGVPLSYAIMYSDARSRQESVILNQTMVGLGIDLGIRFSSSFSLPKVLWAMNGHTAWVKDVSLWIDPTSYILGYLSGVFISDVTNALKFGYDLVNCTWPYQLLESVGIHPNQLANVIKSGKVIGKIRKTIAKQTGLSESTLVVSGMTDGCASQVASGAVNPGEWNSTIGTTLVIKGVTTERPVDPDYMIYSHRHPNGYWMPGAASNTGGIALESQFQYPFEKLNTDVLHHSPSGLVIYPLHGTGERFPFMNPEATGFEVGKAASVIHKYAGYLEGISFLEKLSFDKLASLVPNRVQTVHASGGSAKSVPWLQIRADILNCEIKRATNSTGAMGAAILSASNTVYIGLDKAVSAMVSHDLTVQPRPQFIVKYQVWYERFKKELQNRGYLVLQ